MILIFPVSEVNGPWSIHVERIPRLRPIIVCPQAERMGLNISLLERGEQLEGWTYSSEKHSPSLKRWLEDYFSS